jgi:hypothetical protein
MVHAKRGEDFNEVETWFVAHVIRECINPINKESTLIVRYEDGHEEDVCAGAVHRPEKSPRIHGQPPVPSVSHPLQTPVLGSGPPQQRGGDVPPSLCNCNERR